MVRTGMERAYGAELARTLKRAEGNWLQAIGIAAAGRRRPSDRGSFLERFVGYVIGGGV